MRDFHDAPAITRARLTLIDDSGDHQTADFSGHAGEKSSGVLRLQSHGFTSVPPADAYGYMMRMGQSDRMVALGFETSGRPKSLSSGAVALYDSSGKVLKFIETKTDFDGGAKDMRQRNVKKVQLDADTEYWIKPAPGASIFLGQNAPWSKVMTEGGPAPHVYASLAGSGPDTPQGVE